MKCGAVSSSPKDGGREDERQHKYIRKIRDKWEARYLIDGVTGYVGRFASKKDAMVAQEVAIATHRENLRAQRVLKDFNATTGKGYTF